MNKLEFEQVLEYVRAGETDSWTANMLRIDPDGPQMLHQARLIHEVLGEQSSDTDAKFAEMSPEPADPVEAGRMYRADEPPNRSLFSIKPAVSRPVPAASKMLRRAAGPVRELGELVVVIDRANVRLSFERKIPPAPKLSAAAKRKPKPKDIDNADSGDVLNSTMECMDLEDFDMARFRLAERQERDIDIKGLGIRITLPETLSASEHLRMKVTDTRLGIPSRGLELIFMPETGPFVKIFTNSNGVAELPVPETSGALRFNGPTPQLLHIIV